MDVLFETLDSSEKSFDFGWNRTRVTRLLVCNADHSATRAYLFKNRKIHMHLIDDAHGCSVVSTVDFSQGPVNLSLCVC